jgi:hypothetical protein
MKNPKSEIPEAGVVFATALYLATNYAKSGCPMLCRMLMRQLACLERHPDPSVSPALRDVCRKLHFEWERIGAERAFAVAAANDPAGQDTGRQIH